MPKEQWVPHQRETWPWRIGRLKRTLDTGTHYLHKGELVKIVMVSRMGDVGITNNLHAETGYQARVLLSDLEEEKNAESV